ncbi:ABC transporter substrate-binding protein [Streptomyces litchfieldiae]|uniref:ABC transporter substrate-binding protein n=1 Tax=Streptomyces litchfieldiae TaxID=3075543 RepID=A0ABU2N323_9ACTN|nr:ABC transporter substrate-binding protein [Streptomyces sp. DSM 44938]MDT0347124.1 ABC transporter substrate-binding protein [Streptomyces sp. DSM 44938]
MTARTRTGIAATAVAAALLAATACSAPGDEGGGDGGGGGQDELVVGIANEPETLSPLLGYGRDGNSKIFDGLLRHDENMELQPALATALPGISDDGLTYTYTLREGVEFSDGTPFTARDVVFTYETILDDGTNNPNKDDLNAIESVRAEGDHTVVFTLAYPYAPFADRTVLPIASADAAGGQDVNTGAYNTEPVGTGPYVVTGWTRGERLTFEANPGYWGGEPEVRRLTMAVIPDDDVRATRLRSGDLDAAVLPPNLANTFEGEEGMVTHTAESADFRAVTLPSDNPVTGDRDIRRALDLAVNRELMVDSILEGAGHAAYGPLPTASPWFAEGTERPYDPEAARVLLDEAGWTPGDDGIRVRDGQRAEFTLWYPAGDRLRQEHALAYASDAKEIGIDATVESGSWEVIEGRLAEDAVLSGGGNPADPDFDLYGLLNSELAGDGWNNMGHYDNPAVDEQLEIGRRSGDRAEREAAYDAVQRELAEDPGYTFLTHIDHVYVMADHWDGVTTQFEPHDHGLGHGPWWNVEAWRIRP